MPKEEFARYINNIINKDVSIGLKAYAYVKCEKDSGYELQNMNLLDNLNSKIKELMVCVLKEQYLADDIEFDEISNIVDNRKMIYELKQDDDYKPFKFLDNISGVKKDFSNKDTTKLKGFIFKLNLDSNNVFIYQQSYPATRIKSRNGIHMIKKSGDKFDVFDDDVLRIDKRAEIVIVDDVLYVKSVRVLQEKFKFQSYVRGEADKVIEAIDALGIVTDIEKFRECKAEEKLTNAKKIMKLKNSPVLSVEKDLLIERLLKIEEYKDKIAIEDGKIRTKTKIDVKNVLKMLNDDFLRSELTQKEYDSSIKKEVVD